MIEGGCVAGLTFEGGCVAGLTGGTVVGECVAGCGFLALVWCSARSVLCGCGLGWACGCGRFVLQSSAHAPCPCTTPDAAAATVFHQRRCFPPGCIAAVLLCVVHLTGLCGHLLWFCGRLALPLHTSGANCASHKAALFCGTRFWPHFPFLLVSESVSVCVYEKGWRDSTVLMCM